VSEFAAVFARFRTAFFNVCSVIGEPIRLCTLHFNQLPHMTNQDLAELFVREWGILHKPSTSLLNTSKGIFQLLKNDYTDLSDENLIFIGDLILKSVGLHKGSFGIDGDVMGFLWIIHKKLNFLFSAQSIQIPGSSRIPPLKVVFDLIMKGMEQPISFPPRYTLGCFAVSTMYLISEIEFIFKYKSRYLDQDGKIKMAFPEALKLTLYSSQSGFPDFAG
jgi:hypothetical protein